MVLNMQFVHLRNYRRLHNFAIVMPTSRCQRQGVIHSTAPNDCKTKRHNKNGPWSCNPSFSLSIQHGSSNAIFILVFYNKQSTNVSFSFLNKLFCYTCFRSKSHKTTIQKMGNTILSSRCHSLGFFFITFICIVPTLLLMAVCCS